MTLANITLSDTFLTWSQRINEAVTEVNNLGSGNVTSYSVTITGPGTSLNVQNGVIAGNGALITELQSSQLTDNSINLVSNTSVLTISPTNDGRLGSKAFYTISISDSVNDNNASNIASANSVNSTYALATNGYNSAVGGFSKANSATNTAVGAFDKANTACTTATAAFAAANTKITAPVGTFIQRANNGVGTANVFYADFGQLANGATGVVLDANTIYNVSTANVINYASTITLNFANARNFMVTLTSNPTFAMPSNMRKGQSGLIMIKQDGTGSRTASWNSFFQFATGVAPVLTTTAHKIDIVSYHVDNNPTDNVTRVFCTVAKNFG